FFYIGIGFTPADLYMDMHVMFVMLAFPGTVPVIAIYAILFFRKKEFPRYMVLVLGIFTVIAFGYMLLLFSDLGLGDEIELFINVVGQKIIIYTEMISMSIVTYGLAKYLESKE
ncbi:MAG: hypothetical protein GY870_15475, partial [archaeon]|nr:hypothetical protein [archaeon]